MSWIASFILFSIWQLNDLNIKFPIKYFGWINPVVHPFCWWLCKMTPENLTKFHKTIWSIQSPSTHWILRLSMIFFNNWNNFCWYFCFHVNCASKTTKVFETIASILIHFSGRIKCFTVYLLIWFVCNYTCKRACMFYFVFL